MRKSTKFPGRRFRFLAILLISTACLSAVGCSFGQAVSAGAEATLAAEHGTLFYAFDTLTQPGKSTELLARVIYVKKFKEVEKATVEFTLERESLEKVLTDEEGYARLKWTPPKSGDYDIKVKITAVPDDDYKDMLKVTPASLLVSARPKDAPFIVIDLDHTVVDSGFATVVFSDTAKPMTRADKVVGELAGKYGIIYLTHRPDLLGNKSKDWLTSNGFVRAPLLVSSFKQSIGDSGKFKSGRLAELRKDFPNISIGIGDKISDVEAYVANDMTGYLIPNYDRDDDDAGDFRKLAKKIRKLDSQIHVVDGWEEIRDAILKGQKFPATAYADRLEVRAKELKEDEDDDEEDDDDGDDNDEEDGEDNDEEDGDDDDD
ncbi:MAG: hypothetical protein K8R91_05370 [Phycisphaerae bacterium]|nr:hypothetical protein [Phycisphaerae bacterium]